MTRIDTAKTTSAEEMYTALAERLGDMIPDFEIRQKAELAAEVNRLKQERGAVILGHNYMEPALFHSVCDHKGDSLELSRQGRRGRQATPSSSAACGSWPRRPRS
jgi:quinolinate synthase